MRTKQIFFPPHGYLPFVYGYGRVSHHSQMGDGIDAKDPTGSLPDQDTRIRAYFGYLSRVGGEMERCRLAGVFLEPKAASANRKPFKSRHAGKQIIQHIQAGDHLIVDKFDRLFRDQYDYVTMRRWFEERGITVWFVEFKGMQGNMNSRAFRLLMNIKAIFSEDESENTSERIRMARSSLRASGKDDGSGMPFFCCFAEHEDVAEKDRGKQCGHTGKRVFQDWAVPLMERIAYMKDHEGMHANNIMRIIAKEAEFKRFTPAHVRKLYRFYTAWNATGRPDVSTLKTYEFVAAWWRHKKGEQVEP
jgi:DNA invertase Pin-like site-specific DNA recombinase